MQAPTLKIIASRAPSDCAVCCIAMLCGLTYDKALEGFHHNVSVMGATGHQIIKASKRLKRPLKWKKAPIDVENQTGVLMIEAAKWDFNHLVVLKEGQVIDTDSTLWDVDIFLETYKAKPVGLFTLREN